MGTQDVSPAALSSNRTSTCHCLMKSMADGENRVPGGKHRTMPVTGVRTLLRISASVTMRIMLLLAMPPGTRAPARSCTPSPLLQLQSDAADLLVQHALRHIDDGCRCLHRVETL